MVMYTLAVQCDSTAPGEKTQSREKKMIHLAERHAHVKKIVHYN